MIMTSSPILTPSCRSIAHTPSPSSSPQLRPVASTMIKPTSNTSSSSSAPSQNPFSTSNGTTITASSLPTRSFVRGPQARPYLATKTPKTVEGDTRKFADLVSKMVNQFDQQKRKEELIEMIENVNLSSSPKPILGGSLNVPKRNKSIGGGSLAGSWEVERAELIVDIPVWSPGCFQDLSTLHALRDTTLSHTHALLSHLLNVHNTPATYRLLARSCVQPNHHDHTSHHHGWGCIRLAPSISSPISAPLELKPRERRASLVHTRSSPNTRLELGGAGAGRGNSKSPTRYGQMINDKVIVESEDEEEFEIKLREGYSRSNISTDSESEDDEEESADFIVGREIEKRGGKEGMAFLMTLFGQPALILT
ncbi:uncharacterized protein I206_105683 [Kwoniella pini CBS 10737]|uniref:Uncharacterized protein n=1 Tax=Kwoniella pini CBS 10737 TaxID=1296096 RepID=A0A1B9I3M6_9TREE|nr:uncharacterized protein I206_03415 [Kwoniella pini CBS 10737]OCF50098.1 hypothetical protein I206_03415 [Kwoniella pini CBS 10737]